MVMVSKTCRILVCACVCAVLVLASFAVDAPDSHAATKMKVTSAGIKNGYIDAKYCYADENYNLNTRSLPLKIKNAPKKTKYYAIYMYDKTYPCSHWLATNYKDSNIPANASKKQARKMVQGTNGLNRVGYSGPIPQNKTHTYVIKVYALKSKAQLSNGYTYAQFKKAIKGKTLATATIKGKCKVK